MPNASAKYVKRTRTSLGLTQVELAARLGLDRRSIIRYEQGEELPQLVRLALKYLASQHNTVQK